MALRIPTMAALRCTNGLTSTSTRPLLLSQALHTSAQLSSSSSKPSANTNTSPSAAAARRRHDPYALAKSKKLKEANLQRQQELAAQRASLAADPVLGHTTPFTTQLQTPPVPLPSLDNTLRNQLTPAQLEKLTTQARLNYLMEPGELDTFLTQSKNLIHPELTSLPPNTLPSSQAERETYAKHIHATEAVKRITSLALGSRKDLTRQNKQECISIFGRHNTDSSLPPDPTPLPSALLNKPKPFEKTPRVGPDTGSSEVQAAILTTKILALAEHVKANKKDKMNKRNLRVLCHKRQKHLMYLKRKERGGVRYRNVMEKLGLDEAAISQELMM